MSPERSSRRRWRVRLALLAVSAPGLAVAAIAVGDQVRIRMWKAAIDNPDAAVRTRALNEVGQERERRVADAVFAVLETEQDRAVLGAAGYAAVRMRDRRGVAILQRRADEGPDDAVRANLILHAARLAQHDVRLIDWLTAGAASAGPWRRAGSAVGLLALGQPGGGAILIDIVPELPPEIRRFALREFQRIAEPMAQAIGRPVDWPAAPEREIDKAQWADFRALWERHATTTLLNDVLTRLERRDRKWHEVNRLLHARERVAAWFE